MKTKRCSASLKFIGTIHVVTGACFFDCSCLSNLMKLILLRTFVNAKIKANMCLLPLNSKNRYVCVQKAFIVLVSKTSNESNFYNIIREFASFENKLYQDALLLLLIRRFCKKDVNCTAQNSGVKYLLTFTNSVCERHRNRKICTNIVSEHMTAICKNRNKHVNANCDR